MPIRSIWRSLTGWLFLLSLCSIQTGGFAQSFTPTSFVPLAELSPGLNPKCAVASDFNGDGKIDLLGVRYAGNGFGVFANTSSAGAVHFANESDFPTTGDDHKAVAAADLDGDGKPDLVITNSNPASISVYRNTSAGATINFATNQDYPSNNYPYAIAIGDLDGDGKPDLAIADYSGGVISIYRNTSTPGNISFAARQDLSGFFGPSSVAIGDLDGDGKPELALTTGDAAMGLAVMKNISTPGTIFFEPPTPVAAVSGLSAVTISDLDGDGKPDLVAVNPNANYLVVVRNSSSPGSLIFVAQPNIPSLPGPVTLSIGDLDGDGKPDLVSAGNNPANAVSAFRNSSTPGHLSFDTHADYSLVEAGTQYTTLADLDGNGRPDIITSNIGRNSFVFLSNAIGVVVPVVNGFSPAVGVTGTLVTFRGTGFTGVTAVSFGGVAAGSFTVVSDSVLTAIVGTGASGLVGITNANATINIPAFTFIPPFITSFYPIVADPGDKVTISGGGFAGITSVTFGNVPAASFTVDSLTGITAIVGGGRTGDIVITSPNGMSTISGFIYAPPVVSGFSPVSGMVGSLVTISGKNFDPDPLNDIVYFGAVKAAVVTAGSTQLTVKVPPGANYRPISVTANSLTGYAAAPFAVTFPSDSSAIGAHSFRNAGNFTTGTNPLDLVITDLDGDGKPDVVTLDRSTQNFSLLMNRSSIGHVSFTPKSDFYAGADPERIAVGDLNGDGKPDLVVLSLSSGNSGSVSYFSNLFYNGTLAFDHFGDLDGGNGAQGLSLADMNGDGRPDILICNANTGTYSLFPNTTFNADIVSFGNRMDYPNPNHAAYMITADLDGDGKPDIVTVSAGTNMLSVYRNTGAGGKFAFAPGVDYPTGAKPAFVLAGDLDGDGKPDLLVADSSGNTISFFRNLSTAGQIILDARVDSTGSASSATLADLNGDGGVDAGFSKNPSGTIAVFPNNRGGSGQPPFAPAVDVIPGTVNALLFSGDLDGDSKPDLVTLSPSLNSMSVWRNTIGDPVITSLSTDTGYKGTLISLTGRNFTGTVSVSFGGMPADSFHVVSSTRIDAVVGPGSSGYVTVTTLYGIDSVAGFVFIPQIIAGGPTTFCGGGSVLLTATSANNNQWFQNGIALPGAIETTLLVDSGGVYTVQTTSNGITTVSGGLTVTVILSPAPTISKDPNGDLVSSALSGNQWYLYGAALPGDTSRVLKSPLTGIYQVTAVQNECASAQSAPYYLIQSEIVDFGNDQYVFYYPNPVISQLFVGQHLNNSAHMALDIAITDQLGNTVRALHSVVQAIINVSDLPVGIYYLTVSGNGNSAAPGKFRETVKILKIR